MNAFNLINTILLPLKLIVPQNIVSRIPHLTTNEEIRCKMVFPYLKGYVLDIGCGNNFLIQKYLENGGEGLGVDIYDWNVKSHVRIVKDYSSLDFENGIFDTVTIIASLNYFSGREQILREANRVTKIHGIIILTMVSPSLMRVWNLYKFWDRGINHIGKKVGEVFGFTTQRMHSMLKNAGYAPVLTKRFSWKMNTLYVAKKLTAMDK